MRPLTCALLRVIIVLLALPVSTAFTKSSVAKTSNRQRQDRERRRIALTSTATPKPSIKDAFEKIPSYRKFWHSVVQKETVDPVNRVPCVPTLDRDGPLPPGAYLEHCDSEADPKPICRVTVAVDLTPRLDTAGDFEVDALHVVSRMQKFLDAGFTSFQLKSSPIGSRRDSSKGGDGLQEWGEEQIFSRLRKETPAFALRQCHLVVPMEIPNANAAGTVTATSIRKTVLTTLDRTGGDCIDSLQLSQSDYVPSPYTFDVLDCLEDLKREGHVRSVTGNNLSWRLIREAHRCGFAIDSNQVDGNLLNPTAFDNPDQQLACQDLGTKLLVSGPLAGALLSDRHYVDLRQSKRRGGRMLSLPRKESTRPFTTSEWYHVKKSMVHWGDCQGDLEPNPSAAARWKLYQEKVLSALHDIAQKHDVSMATVALRWTLQVDHVASAVVTCRLLSGDNGDPRLLQDRSQQLRQVFKFELDEDDMDRLWQVSGRVVPEPFDRDRDEDEEFMEMMESEKGLFLPPRRNRKPPPRDGSSRTLWL